MAYIRYSSEYELSRICILRHQGPRDSAPGRRPEAGPAADSPFPDGDGRRKVPQGGQRGGPLHEVPPARGRIDLLGAGGAGEQGPVHREAGQLRKYLSPATMPRPPGTSSAACCRRRRNFCTTPSLPSGKIPTTDGGREPVTFPAKIPVILVQGAEGIAVGMSTKILPHNFIEVIDAVKAALKGKKFTLYPDFPTGGQIDVSGYEDGMGKVLVRAKLDTSDPKRIVIRELPFGSTTESLITSVENAAKKGKIKIAGISDFTTEKVEIEIKLARGVQADEVIDALYAFTDCETSISVNLLVIRDRNPVAMTVTEVINHHAGQLVEILREELKLEDRQLRDRLHMRTLEQIFIEERIYKRIEQMKTQRDGDQGGHRRFRAVRRTDQAGSDRRGRRAASEDSHPPHFALRYQQGEKGNGRNPGPTEGNRASSRAPRRLRGRIPGRSEKEVRGLLHRGRARSSRSRRPMPGKRPSGTSSCATMRRRGYLGQRGDQRNGSVRRVAVRPDPGDPANRYLLGHGCPGAPVRRQGNVLLRIRRQADSLEEDLQPACTGTGRAGIPT